MARCLGDRPPQNRLTACLHLNGVEHSRAGDEEEGEAIGEEIAGEDEHHSTTEAIDMAAAALRKGAGVVNEMTEIEGNASWTLILDVTQEITEMLGPTFSIPRRMHD
jgi:hypothetical protein